MTCECCAELTARVEALEREKSELSNRVNGDHHPRLGVLDEQVEGLIDTTDDLGTDVVSLKANYQRLNGLVLRHIRAVSSIDTNSKSMSADVRELLALYRPKVTP